MLDALRGAGARATFFVLGPCVARHPELVQRMLAEGHGVGVHAQRHVRHSALTADEGAADLQQALAALHDVGVRPVLWRTPWGDEAPWTRAAARDRDLRIVRWTADTHDWRGDRAATMLGAVAPEVRPGAVVLAHDGLGPGARRDGCAETVALIAPLVRLARARGLRAEPL